MKIEFMQDVINLKTDNLVIELQEKYKLCTVYRPNSVIGQRLGSFLYKGMTITEFLNEIKKLAEL